VAIAAVSVLGACAADQSPSPATIVVASAPKAYTCEQQRATGRELAALRQFIDDYGQECRQLRAARGDPSLAACLPPGRQ
jgi:hypothetical protein